MDIKEIIKQQQNEITAYAIYMELSNISTNEKNTIILKEIAEQELMHYYFWEKISKKKISPNQRHIKKYKRLAKILGLSFTLRLMESKEADASEFYDSISSKYPEALAIKTDEEEHEQKLIGILTDNRLNYAGAIVLGLNDALVEFTGTLAGLTFAFGNSLIVGTTGLIMGIAASLSMAASGYLSSREESNKETNPITSAVYTGLAYLITVGILVLPYFIFQNTYLALSIVLGLTIMIIALYTYYISVAKLISFKKRFLEMVLISLTVALISFGIGLFIKKILHI